MVVEKRLFVRFSISGSVIIQPDPKKSDSVDCQMIDLSYDGVGLYSPKELQKDTPVKFLIINRQLNVNIGGLARVVFCKAEQYNGQPSFRVGLEFSSVDQRQVKATLMDVREVAPDKRISR